MPDRRRGPITEAKRLVNRVRHRGPKEVLDLAFGRLRDSLRSSEEIVLHVRDADEVGAEGEGLIARLATEADADRYARDIGTDSPDTFRARLAPDVMCLVVEDEGRLLHASWLTTTAAWTREIRAYLSPPPGDAYIYESFTRADARGRGIYPAALAGLLNLSSERGYGRLWVGVERSNVPSLRAVAKAGFEEAFGIRYRRSLGRFSLIDRGRGGPEEADFLRYGSRLPASGV